MIFSISSLAPEMPSLTLDRLIADDGEVDPIIYWAMVRRRCMREYGAVSPRALRAAIAHYSEMIRILQEQSKS
jgi:hypothetical protein